MELNIEGGKQRFQKTIISWYRKNGRSYPWRETQDPFKIIIAEITLKLTGAWKAEKVYNYIEEKYGSPKKMAVANLEDLQNHFKPLGLINRCNMLIDVANDIQNRFDGEVPRTYNKLISIKGIGQYTANSVLCFAYNKRLPLVDSSTQRIFKRCFSYKTKVQAYADKKLWKLAEDLLPYKKIKDFNLGLIDLGALVCRYNNPEHDKCPLKDICEFQKER